MSIKQVANVFLSLLFVIVFIGCSNDTTISPPEGISQKFYSDTIEVLKLIDEKMHSVESMNSSEKQKIDFFFQENKPKSEKETLIYNSLAILYPAYKTNLFSHSKDDLSGRQASLEIYVEEYEKLAQILELE